MTRNRAMASILGPAHELNLDTFKEAARSYGVDTAKRKRLESPWVVEVVVYNDVGPTSYVATVGDGVLLAWKEIASCKDDSDSGFESGLGVGVFYYELENGLADGTFVLLDEWDSDEGRVKIAARAVPASAVWIVEWRDPHKDGSWVWIKTSEIHRDWLPKLWKLLAEAAHERGGQNREGSEN